MRNTSMRSKSLLLFLTLLLSWSVSLVMSMDDLRIIPQVKAKSHLRDFKEQRFLEHATYEEAYTVATQTYKGGPSPVPVQIVDEHGNFMTLPRTAGGLELEEVPERRRAHESMMGLMAAVKGLHPRNYFVVSVFGHQSTGKSHLLNAVFGTDFAEKGRELIQKTRGVWLARSPVMDDVLVVDCEGSGGAEKLLQKGREAVISEFGMLYAMLVSQVVIFNMKQSQVNDVQERTMFINIIGYYMNNRMRGTPPLRVILSIRDVDASVALVDIEKHARAIIVEAYKSNGHNGEGAFEDFFDVQFFWFGNFKAKEIVPYDHLGYDETFLEESEIGEVTPHFSRRLGLFKSRFTNRHGAKCYFKDIVSTIEAPQLPCFLHQFWNVVNAQEGVGLENVLELTVEKRLGRAVEAFSVQYERLLMEFIRENARTEPSEIIDPLDRLVQRTRESMMEELPALAPRFGGGMVHHYSKILFQQLNEIATRCVKLLLIAVAKEVAVTTTQAATIDLQGNTHAAELRALARFPAAIVAIQKIDSECKPVHWAGPIELALETIRSRVQVQQTQRIQHTITHRIGEVNRDDNNFVRGVQELAQSIHEREEVPVLDLESAIAAAFYAGLKPGHRKQKVLDVFEHHYAGNHENHDTAIARAEDMRDQLVAFRTHFNDRVHFAASAEDWHHTLSDSIQHAAGQKVIAHERHQNAQKELARLQLQLDAGQRENSIRWALAMIMLYYVITDFSILQVIFFAVIYILALSGMLGPQLMDPERLAALPGIVIAIPMTIVRFVQRLLMLRNLGRHKID